MRSGKHPLSVDGENTASNLLAMKSTEKSWRAHAKRLTVCCSDINAPRVSSTAPHRTTARLFSHLYPFRL